MTTILAIDQGTTSTRAFAIEADGTRRLVYARRHQQFHPRSGWVEHDGAEILADLRACLAQAPDSVAAVALGNQGESCLAWDGRDGTPLGPIIVWQDDRTATQLEPLRGSDAEALSLSRCGLPLDPYFSASKLGWLVKVVPQATRLLQQGHLRLGTTDAWFRDRLCGTFATDVTTAARTGLLNLATEQWDQDLCALHGVPLTALPTITDSAGAVGVVDCAGRALPLLASLVDQQAALYGHGCRRPGDSKITFGTGAFALAVTGGLPSGDMGGAGPLPTVAWRKDGQSCTYALDAGVYCASAAVDWARGLGLFRDFSEIEQFPGPPAISQGLAFVPALAGLACPHWNREARGLWSGLSLASSRLDLVRSVLEGVALRSAEALGAIETQIPLTGEVSIDGGLTGSPYFCQFLSTVLERPVRVSANPELTSLGLAMMAAETLGLDLQPQQDHLRYQPQEGGSEARALFAQALARAL
jgi:glycerol kinase